MQQQPSLSKPALLHKLPAGGSALHQCFFVWKRVEMLQLHSHDFPRKEASEKLPHGHVGAESLGHSLDGAQGWWQVESHPNLLSLKNSWRSSHPYP